MEADHYKIISKQSRRTKYLIRSWERYRTYQKISRTAQTATLIEILKKQNEGIWTDEHTKAFKNLERVITQLTCLAHYNKKNDILLTSDAKTKGLGTTLCQKQKDGNLKPIEFASRFVSYTEKKHAINELEVLAVVFD